MSRPAEPAMGEEVPEALDGERLDRTVAFMAGVSRSRAGSAVDDGLVSVDGDECTQRAHRVRAGQVVGIGDLTRDADAGPVAQPDVSIDVVHADEDVLVLEKPSGLVVHPGAGNPDGTLVNGVLAAYPEVRGVGSEARPGIVHRLDRGTSGLLVVALSQDGYDGLVEQLADRSMGRRYVALAWGRFTDERGVVDAPVGRSPRDRTRMAVVASGRSALTRYEVLGWWPEPGVSMVECVLDTGRTHQIRVHLTAIGHPLVGDSAYGGDRPGLSLDRPFLHASHLSFDHPGTGSRMAFESGLPHELEQVVAALGECA